MLLIDTFLFILTTNLFTEGRLFIIELFQFSNSFAEMWHPFVRAVIHMFGQGPLIHYTLKLLHIPHHGS